jgi:acrylyl-CoA reductase (NADPH)
MFNAILLNKNDDGSTAAQLGQMDDAQLPADGDVTVAVDYSTINYKDGLAITGRAPVVRKWPMVPGIDGAGQVLASSHPDWKAGDAFILNGWGVGETHMGCLAQRARLKGDWLIRRPDGMSARTAMAIGTAGYTAMLSALALEEQGVKKDSGEILVTGASGGVGSVAIAILSGLGYRVVASTGKLDEADYLKSLGAVEVLDRAALSAPGKPLQKERWAGVVDSVGSHTLVNAVAQVRYGGVVTACGLAQGCALHPARRAADRHRQRDGAAGAPHRCLEPPGERPRYVQARCHHPRDHAGGGADAGAGNHRWQGARPPGRQRQCIRRNSA